MQVLVVLDRKKKQYNILLYFLKDVEFDYQVMCQIVQGSMELIAYYFSDLLVETWIFVFVVFVALNHDYIIKILYYVAIETTLNMMMMMMQCLFNFLN